MRCSEPTATAPRTSRKRRRAERGDEEAEWFACACAGKMVLSRCRCTIFSRALRVQAHHSAASLKGHRPHRVLAPCARLDDLGDDSEKDRRCPYATRPGSDMTPDSAVRRSCQKCRTA